MGGVKGQRQVPRWYMSKLNLGQNFKLLWGRSLSKFLHLKRHRAWQVGNFCYCVAVCSVLCYIYTHLYILVQNCYSFSFIFACKPHNFWSYNNLQGGGSSFPFLEGSHLPQQTFCSLNQDINFSNTSQMAEDTSEHELPILAAFYRSLVTFVH